MPIDAHLPHFFAEQLNAPIRAIPRFADWLSSDRPPLQAGLNLLVWTVAAKEPGSVAVGVAAQSWVWVGLWALMSAYGIRARTMVFVVAGAAFSGFFFLNSFYYWPKLLPAALVALVPALLLAGPKDQRWAPSHAALAGAAAALAMLGHGGSAFAFMSLSLVLAVRARRNLPAIAIAAVVAMGVHLPWTLYQKLCDPPGDRLVKMHLAGVGDVDPRAFGTVVREAYGRLTLAEIALNKVHNLQMMWWDPDGTGQEVRQALDALREGNRRRAYAIFTLRAKERGFYHYLQTASVLSVGYLGCIVLLRRRHTAEARLAAHLAILFVLTAVIWCGLMFSPKSTVIHHSSYFMGVCLFALLGLGLAALPTWAGCVVLLTHACWFVVVWVIDSPFGRRIDGVSGSFPGFWAGMILALAAGAWCLSRHVRHEQSPAASETG